MVHSTDGNTEGNGEKDEVSIKEINWSRVISNSISTVIAAIIFGAGVIVWNAAIRQPEEIREKVDEANRELKATQKNLAAELTRIGGDLSVITKEHKSLRDELARYVKAVEKKLPKSANGKPEKPHFQISAELPEKQWTAEQFAFENDKILARIQKK